MSVRPSPEKADASVSPGSEGASDTAFKAAIIKAGSPLATRGGFHFFRHPFRDKRVVAFDGFRSQLHDDKLERDRRYGTVYTVEECQNGYLITFEMPRRMPESSLKEVWEIPEEMPDYNYSLSLDPAALTIRAGLGRESLRRLSYISASFPSDFQTRIEFPAIVSGMVHRLRNKNLEIIVFKG